jgi:hypothetical protein
MIRGTTTAFVLMGFLSVQPVLAAPQADLPNVHVGDIWQYRSVDEFTGETKLEFSHQIVDLSDREIVTQLKNKGSSASPLRYYTRQWGSLDIENAKFDPYYPLFDFPLSVGKSWKKQYRTTFANGDSSSSFLEAKVTTFEKITVPAGSFDAFRVEYSTESMSADANANISKGKVTVWYAPAVNHLIRRETVISSNGRVRSKAADELVAYSSPGQRLQPPSPNDNK